MSEDRSYIIEDRLRKLEQLREHGVEPFAYSYRVTHTSTAARKTFSETDEETETVRVAGRIVGLRAHGKTTFAHLADRAGKIQLYFRKDELGDAPFDILNLLDIGDWIGVEGKLMRTKTGELTIRVASFEVLAKSIRPLPIGKEEVTEAGDRVVHSGFSDVEQRYRQRYADLAVHPEVRDVFYKRTRLTTALRKFLDDRGFIEVETPVLQPLYGGASAKPFITHHNALDMRLYLRIADELYLKRLIVGGLERVYEISKDFRNEGLDRTHNPEFTMLEFYQAFADYEDMMQLVEEMIVHAARATSDSLELPLEGKTLRFEPPFARLPFLDAIKQHAGFDAAAESDGQLRARVKKLGIPDSEKMGRGKLLDELFGEYVEPQLWDPVFIVDYPRELSPLAKPKRGNPALVERFELMIAGREIANAFSELNDPIDQRARFAAQVALREKGDEEAQSYDEDYVRALEYGMPPTGGVGIGIDRLTMLLTDQSSIRDVILFPTMRPEE
ncbi:MAG: lysine--tRNA ligase [Gemmatimonadota bacterium]